MLLFFSLPAADGVTLILSEDERDDGLFKRFPSCGAALVNATFVATGATFDRALPPDPDPDTRDAPSFDLLCHMLRLRNSSSFFNNNISKENLRLFLFANESCDMSQSREFMCPGGRDFPFVESGRK